MKEPMIQLTYKLAALDIKLIELLESLDSKDWNKQTVARLWTVKDVAAHLLDGNIRVLSGLRDGHREKGSAFTSYQELVDYLNQLNAEWVQAMKRVSPNMLIELLKLTGKPFCDYYASLDLKAQATFPVAWAGENESTNRMHIAREYTEKFLHQQQIRDATDKQGIMTSEFYLPFLDVCMYALPYTLRDAKATSGSTVKMEITGQVSGEWYVIYNGHHWERTDQMSGATAEAEISIHYYAAWKLFSKSLRPEDLADKITIRGNQNLGEKAVEIVSFMA